MKIERIHPVAHHRSDGFHEELIADQCGLGNSAGGAVKARPVGSDNRERAGEVLERIVEFARMAGASICARRSAIPRDAPRDGDHRRRYDLVGMGSHSHSAFGSLVLGSVVQRALSSWRSRC